MTDVSSVGLDWLYLRTDRPLFLTDRHHDAERLRQEVPGQPVRRRDRRRRRAGPRRRCITARLEYDEHHLARVAMRNHYFDDMQVGESTARFLDTVSGLVMLRDRLLGAGPAPDAITA